MVEQVMQKHSPGLRPKIRRAIDMLRHQIAEEGAPDYVSIQTLIREVQRLSAEKAKR